jgi:hypothetical protein
MASRTPRTPAWANPGDKGTPKNLDLDELHIDHDNYQRPEKSAANTKYIAQNFSWSSCGMIVVMQRANGKYYIVDGQQRWLAAKMRGDIKKMLCLVFQSTGPKQEAIAFKDLNTRRFNVPPVYKFRAGVTAQSQPEYTINEWLEEFGFEVADSPKQGMIRFPAILVTLWKQNEEASKSSLLLQYELCNDEDPMNAGVHRGLWYLYHNNIDIDKHAKKIVKMGGIPRLLQAIRALELAEVAGSGTQNNNRICALGILRVVNKGLRKKYRLKSALIENGGEE